MKLQKMGPCPRATPPCQNKARVMHSMVHVSMSRRRRGRKGGGRGRGRGRKGGGGGGESFKLHSGS